MHAVRLLRLPFRLWYAHTIGEGTAVPHPRDAPTATAGTGATRVLILGNGPCFGWGVTTHQLALTGALARAVAARTGGCRTDYVGDERMDSLSARRRLGNRATAGYDAAVLAMGISDAIRLTSVRRWHACVAELLRILHRDLLPGAPVLVGRVPELLTIPGYANAVGRLATPHARRLDAATAEVVAAVPAARLFDVPAPGFDGRAQEPASEAYRRLGGVLAGTIVPLLPEARSPRHPEARRTA